MSEQAVYDLGVPEQANHQRMRHIALGDYPEYLHRDQDTGQVIALCGYKLPIIENYDPTKDVGPVASADCIVCRDLYAAWGGLEPL